VKAEIDTGKGEGDIGVRKVSFGETGVTERVGQRMLVEGKDSWDGNYWHGGILLIGK
jgi:hypothetical protein